MWNRLISYKNYLLDLLAGFITDCYSAAQEHLQQTYAPEDEPFVVGDIVRFKDKVYEAPYKPYYDSYKGSVYVVEKILNDRDELELENPGEDFSYVKSVHIKLRNLDSNGAQVSGCIHPDEIELTHIAEKDVWLEK